MRIHRIFSSQELFLRSGCSESLAQTQKTDLAIKILQTKGKKQATNWNMNMRGSLKHLPQLNCCWKFSVQGLSAAPSPKVTEENSQYSSSQFCYGAQCRLATHFYFKKLLLLTQNTQHSTGVSWKEHSHSPGNPREFPSLDETSPLSPGLLWGLRQEAQRRFVQNFRE